MGRGLVQSPRSTWECRACFVLCFLSHFHDGVERGIGMNSFGMYGQSDIEEIEKNVIKI